MTSTEKKNGHVNDGFEGDIPEKRNGYHDNRAYDDSLDKGKEIVQVEDNDEEEEEDPWKVTAIEVDETPWSELSCAGRTVRLMKQIGGIVLILAFLYLFICSLDFLSSAFKLLGGKTAGQVFRNNKILTNPVAGLMIGVLVTVLVQSSSTSTSIVISMVGADILTIPIAIPIIMGANIGTSVTNTIVAMGQITNKADFRRAFAGATVHDMFNWLTVIIFLPIEVITGYLGHLSSALVGLLPENGGDKEASKDLLKVITKPFTKLIIEVDKNIITKIAKKEVEHHASSLMKTCSDKQTPGACCDDVMETMKINTTKTYTVGEQAGVCSALNPCVAKDSCLSFFDGVKFDCSKFALDTDCCLAYSNSTMVASTNETDRAEFCNGLVDTCKNNYLVTQPCMTKAWLNSSMFSCDAWIGVETDCLKPKTYLFMGLAGKIDDVYIGAILLVVSLAILCICLVCIVKLLNALLKGQIALIIKKFINADFPGKVCGYFTGYLAILLGAGLTILVQSSSIFTSTLTPLVGIGVIELERMYPLTLGANIGTTTTGILSALAQDGNKIRDSLQVALCHLFFNISGIIVFYPLPFFRPAIPLAKFLGNTTAKYRWFALVYLFFMFFLLPAAVFGLSVPGWYVLAAVLIPIVILLIIILIIKLIQRKRSRWLPKKLQNWKFLPEPMRSLRPYDSIMQRICCSVGDNKPEGSNRKSSVGEGRRRSLDTRL